MLEDITIGIQTLKDSVCRRPMRSFVMLFIVLGVFGLVAPFTLRTDLPPIRSDGFGYYVYLPAFFIYHDISLKSIAHIFISNNMSIFQSIIGTSYWEYTANYLIKYPMGVAVMMPFFIIACFISFVLGAPFDGFSPIFQSMAVVSGFVYGIAGLIVLWKVLEKHFSQNTIALVMFGIVFGTNLFHYATFDANVSSHIYSFFLFSSFLLINQKLYNEGSLRQFSIAGALAGLITITRPTNGLGKTQRSFVPA